MLKSREIKRKRIYEEITKADIKNIVDSKIEQYLKQKEFENRVNDIISDTFEKFFRMMYNKRGFWKNDIKR